MTQLQEQSLDYLDELLIDFCEKNNLEYKPDYDDNDFSSYCAFTRSVSSNGRKIYFSFHQYIKNDITYKLTYYCGKELVGVAEIYKELVQEITEEFITN